MCAVPAEARRRHWIPSPRTEDRQLLVPYGCLELNLDPQEEQSVLLTTEPPFQPQQGSFPRCPVLMHTVVYTQFLVHSKLLCDLISASLGMCKEVLVIAWNLHIRLPHVPGGSSSVYLGHKGQL